MEPFKIATLADIEAVEATPWAAREKATSTYEIFAQSARQYGDSPALTFVMTGDPECKAYTSSYAQLFADITQTANLFHAHGIAKDDVVSYLLPNLPDTHHVIWGGQAAGIVNAVNPLLDSEHIIGIMNAAQAKILVTLPPLPGQDMWEKASEVAAKVPTLEKIFVVNPLRYIEGMEDTPVPVPVIEGLEVLDFAREKAKHAADALTSQRVFSPEDVCAYFHTGGTTGVPKLALHTHANEVYMAWVFANLDMSDTGEAFICGLPLFHVNAVIVTGLGTFQGGTHVILLTPQGYRTPDVIPNFWKTVERFKAVNFSGVPTILSALLELPREDVDISSLKFAGCGAAPLSQELFDRFEKASGLSILEGYGLTEGTCASAMNPPHGERRIGSVGLRLPYQKMATAILKEDGTLDHFCDVDEPGVVMISGPNVIRGYKQEHANKGLFVEGEWLNTGDLGRIDAQGYLWLVGREKDLIIRGGHNIDPAAIEEPLATHPDVALVAAIGQVDAYAGEVPMAYVTLRPGTNVTSEALTSFARENIAERAAVPKRVEIIETMPVTAVGKIFKPPLRVDAAQWSLQEALNQAGLKTQLAVRNDPKKGLVAALSGDAVSEALSALKGFPVVFEQ
ncbi:MAG: fatty-acyl-CoA synthase [Parvibaculaceae bacterium]|jgi:fatty-acyl-CoA synthase|nr:acyl-CoA synthetase [Parvibaculaceae bacterium]